MVSTRPLISRSSSPFINPLVTVLSASITIGINVTFMFHSIFSSLIRSRYLSFFSHSFNFTLWSAGTAKSSILQVYLFFINYYKVWSSGRDLVICFYVKILLEFVCVILQDRCWVVHIPFVCIIIIIIIYSLKFFSSVLADGLSRSLSESMSPYSLGLLSVFWLFSTML